MNSISSGYAARWLIHSTDVALFALADGLQYERYYGAELVYQPHTVLPLFNRYPDSRIAFAGPWLIRINGQTEMRERLEVLETALPAVSWLVSPAPEEELVAHLRKNMDIILPDGQAALLRFQDPRVQFRLGEMLESEQHRELTGITREWVTSREGKCWSFKQRRLIC